ncbi:hypothetical protein KIM67_01475 [Flagellimonas sp. 389]|uniref:hypothetical protein n=1 Tax=Flagellimonas sp. 389 TaxID=2835862 RepID=UPI001BD2D86E|nr:hypothetical protein [Flagellimonas sp. 389]MBS9461062.1 hypothetical protein [Flagellimonas sp. 389]
MRLLILGILLISIVSCNREVEFDAVLMEGSAPTLVQANIQFNNEEPPFLVTLTPTAIGATAFEVLSGLPGDTSVLVGIQQEVNFSYPESDENFFVTIRAIAPNDLVTEEQFEVIPPEDPCEPIFGAPVTWDSGGDPSFSFSFGNIVNPPVVENPDPSGANPEVSNVLEIVDTGGNPFDGFGVQMTAPANFSAEDKIVRLLFWSEVEVPVRLNMQQDPNNETEREVEVTVVHSGNGWEELRFDFVTALAGFTPEGEALGIPDGEGVIPTGEYIRFQMTIGAGDAELAGTFYLDNVGVCQ